MLDNVLCCKEFVTSLVTPYSCDETDLCSVAENFVTVAASTEKKENEKLEVHQGTYLKGVLT